MNFFGKAALATAPSAVNAINQIVNPSQPSEFEEKVANFAEVFGEQAKSPVTENSMFKSGKSVIDSRDKKNRERTENTLGAGNVTAEGKLAGMQANNEVFAQMLNSLMERSQRFKEMNQGKYLNALGLGERLKQNRLNRRNISDNSLVSGLSKGVNAFLLADAQGDGKE